MTLLSFPTLHTSFLSCEEGAFYYDMHGFTIALSRSFIECIPVPYQQNNIFLFLHTAVHWRQKRLFCWLNCRYVMSESLAARKAIKAICSRGRTVITDTTSVIHHTDCARFPTAECTGSHALRTAAGHLWVFSATDVQVRHTVCNTMQATIECMIAKQLDDFGIEAMYDMQVISRITGIMLGSTSTNFVGGEWIA